MDAPELSGTSSCSTSSHMECCWICLEEEGELRTDTCSCPRAVHATCLGRWCLQNVGRRAENTCRFCDGPLPDWADLLLPGRLPPAAATVNVYGPDGRLHRLPLRPGQAGRKRFLAAVRSALGLPEQVQLTLNFEVPVPCRGTGGPGAPLVHSTTDLEVASRLATLNAALRRMPKRQREQQQQQAEGGGSAPSEATPQRRRRHAP